MERLYKITGTGWFFHDFYVEATSLSHAEARAMDILHAQKRSESGHYPQRSAVDQIRNIELAPVVQEVVVIAVI